MSDLVRVWSLAADRPFDPRSAVERACDRIDAVDRTLQAFLPEPARRERLKERIDALADGAPLRGVPVGVKDIVRVHGFPTRGGADLPAGVLDGPQASIVTALEQAGALVAGKTVTAEFAAAAPGPTRNPHDPRVSPGGSSSGSAAAVAAGMVPLALGTQTVGSVIRPAAFCGIVGFKPTYGRIPADGVIANAPTYDTLGTFTADVASAAAAAAVVCPGWTPTPPSPDVPVLGIPVGPYLDQAQDSALAAFRDHVAGLRDAGVVVREVPVLADLDAVARTSFLINRYEFARTHASWFVRYGDRYRAESVRAIRQGREVSFTRYTRALAEREHSRHRIAEAMGGIDAWVSPAATGPAPTGLATTGDPAMCMPWSHLGLPSITLPAGAEAHTGLPLGLQLVGPYGADERLMAVAAAIEDALPPVPWGVP